MKYVVVRCVRPVDLTDLGLVMRGGEEKTLLYDRVVLSSQYNRALREGALEVQRVFDAQGAGGGAPPPRQSFVRSASYARPQPREVPSSPVPPPSDPVVPSPPSQTPAPPSPNNPSLAQVLTEQRDLRDTVLNLTRTLQTLLERGVPTSAPSGFVPIATTNVESFGVDDWEDDEDTPFIPSDLGREYQSTHVNVDEATERAEGLEDAQALLSQLKGSSRRKRKKKES